MRCIQVAECQKFPLHLKPHHSHLHPCLTLTFASLFFPLHLTQQNSELGPHGISLQCLELENLEVTYGDAVSMMLRCLSPQRLVLSHMPKLETCSIECTMHQLNVMECPLLDVSSMIHPTLFSLRVVHCIVSDITMEHTCHMRVLHLIVHRIVLFITQCVHA